jgi:hypothetical protein
VLIGSYLSSHAPDKYIRPIITFVIFASGLKYVGVGTTALGWILVIVALGGMAAWLLIARPWSSSQSKQAAATASAGAGPASVNGHVTITSAVNGTSVNGTASANGAESPNGAAHPAAVEPETTAHSADPAERPAADDDLSTSP